MDLGTRLATATFRVDAAELRSTLDRIKAAVGTPTGLAHVATAALAHDRGAVAASLRDVLSHLDSVDLKALQAVSGMVHEYRAEHTAAKLRDLFARLQDGWRGRVTAMLGADRVPVVSKLLRSPSPDLLRILGKEDDENAHSDLIAWLLTPRKAPTIAPVALSRLTARLSDPSWQRRIGDSIRVGSLSIRREVVIAREFCGGTDRGRVDICVSGPEFILAIENKVWSREHSDQTHGYWNWIEPMHGLRGGLLLSPSGVAARCPNFQAVSYLELVSCLVEAAAYHPITEAEEIVLGSYLKTLARSIVRVEMRAVRELASTEQS